MSIKKKRINDMKLKEKVQTKKEELVKEYEHIKAQMEELNRMLLKTEGAILILQTLETESKE